MLTIADIQPLPITLANEHVIRPHFDKVRAFAQEKNAVGMMRTVARLRVADPMLSDLIDEFGRPSDVWFAKQVDTMISNDAAFREHHTSEGLATTEPLTREMANETAKKDHTRIMSEYFVANPEVARQLYFDFGAYPATLEGLKIGIDTIRHCADLDALERAHGGNARELITTDSEFWQNVTAAEVAAWVTRFCELWQ